MGQHTQYARDDAQKDQHLLIDTVCRVNQIVTASSFRCICTYLIDVVYALEDGTEIDVGTVQLSEMYYYVSRRREMVRQNEQIRRFVHHYNPLQNNYRCELRSSLFSLSNYLDFSGFGVCPMIR